MRRWLALALLPLLSACGSVAPFDAPSASAAPTAVIVPVPSVESAPAAAAASPMVGATPVAGATPRPAADFTVGGSRPVAVHVPGTATAETPAALVIALHGSGSSGRGVESYLHLDTIATTRGIILAAPDGTKDADGKRFWDATAACCDFDHTGVDDSGYLRDVIDAIRDRAPVDPKRIYVVGFSNGGFMGYRLACDHADLIAAVVSLSGAADGASSRCRPTEPVAILEIHGTADGSVAYGGGRITGVGSAARPPAAYPGARQTAATWARYDGCAPSPIALAGREDVDAGINGSSGVAEATRQAWEGCAAGGAAELWTVPGGDHAPAISTSFPEAALDFLLAHPKP